MLNFGEYEVWMEKKTYSFPFKKKKKGILKNTRAQTTNKKTKKPKSQNKIKLKVEGRLSGGRPLTFYPVYPEELFCYLEAQAGRIKARMCACPLGKAATSSELSWNRMSPLLLY